MIEPILLNIERPNAPPYIKIEFKEGFKVVHRDDIITYQINVFGKYFKRTNRIEAFTSNGLPLTPDDFGNYETIDPKDIISVVCPSPGGKGHPLKI